MKLVIVGAGIIGLASARAALQADPTVDVTIVEKGVGVAQHQTSHNSGVVHAGLYYKPDSLKSRLCRRGVGLMRAYCHEHNLPYEECGKVLVATTELEVGRLTDIEERAAANGVPTSLVSGKPTSGSSSRTSAGLAVCTLRPLRSLTSPESPTPSRPSWRA